MASNTVTVGCKLPNGLTIKHKGVTKTLCGATHKNALVGFGLTQEIDADWFDSWLDEAKDLPAVKNGSIFAHGKDTAGMTAERAKDDSVKTGMEPLDPDKPAPDIERVPGTENPDA